MFQYWWAGQGAQREEQDEPLQRGGGRPEGGQTGDEQADHGAWCRHRQPDRQNKGGKAAAELLPAPLQSRSFPALRHPMGEVVLIENAIVVTKVPITLAKWLTAWH